MNTVETAYGVIGGCMNMERHGTGQLASVLLTSPAELKTPYGALVPQYEVEDMGRKEHKYVIFYPNGTVRKVPLQEAQNIPTQYGDISAEMVLFYNNGALKRLFPLTGKLSGFWTEEHEFALAKNMTLSLPCGEITAKMISMGFFKSGAVRSLTFWPGEVVTVKTSIGLVEARTGIAFYEDGSIRSLEPVRPTFVETPIGKVQAFDNDPDGISGDMNSLCFGSDGAVSALTTTTSQVTVITDVGEKKVYSPEEKESLCSESVKIAVPLLIEFSGNKVLFNKRDEYDVDSCSFKIEAYVADLIIPCYECG